MKFHTKITTSNVISKKWSNEAIRKKKETSMSSTYTAAKKIEDRRVTHQIDI